MQENDSTKKPAKKEYSFGEIKEYDLEKIEAEVLQESVYLDVFAGSDIVFKEDCVNLTSQDMMEKMSKLQGYSFKYKNQDFPEHSFPMGTQFGFMAQDVEEQFPELIKKDSNGNRFVNYLQMIPIMAEAIKELSSKVEMLEKKLTEK
jgi:hypothetical protein